MNIEPLLSADELEAWNKLIATAPLQVETHMITARANDHVNSIGEILDVNEKRIEELQHKLDILNLKLQALINMLPDHDINVEELL